MKAKILLIRFGTYIFVGILLAFGVLFLILPKQKISENEKRALAPMPTFSWASLSSGKYLDSLDMFVSDNFPFREGFVQTNFALAQMRGFKSEVSFYKQEVVTNAGMDKVEDSTLTEIENDFKPEDEIIEGEAEKSPIRGVMIYNDMAIQLFGGNDAAAKYSAEVANFYQETLKGKAQVYCIVVPTHQEFYLPHKYRHSSEKKNIEYLYSQLAPEVKSVDVVSTLYKHKNEYIYFNTDHHWTGLGAYYAYQAFCKAAGWEAVPLSRMERRVIPDFLGSLYWLTRDARLKENMDSVVYHKPPVSYQAYNCIGAGYKGIAPAFLFADFAKGHLGSNLERIVRASHKPVFVASRAFKPISKVLVAYDGG
ncbi:MAG: DHHW family protein, partial [Raineya sp.]